MFWHPTSEEAPMICAYSAQRKLRNVLDMDMLSRTESESGIGVMEVRMMAPFAT